MNIFKKYLISIFLMVLLINTAYGFPGMGGNNTTIAQNTGIQTPLDLKNATESDQDIIISQHLIEIDALQLQSENKLFIRETLIFKNIGLKDFYGSLRTWLPDGNENIKLSKSEMMQGGEMTTLDFNKTGNIISWQEYIEKNSSLPPLYYVEYVVAQEASSGNESYSKKLLSPTLINYKYGSSPFVIIIKKANESSVKFFDENRNEIKPVDSDENGGIYRFSPSQFKEVNVELSKSSVIPAAKQNYTVYVVIGILILLVLVYPYISSKLKRGKSDKTSKVTSSSNAGKSREEKSRSVNNSPEEKLKGNSDADMDPLRKELGLKLKELETKYKSGDLLDEEYEDEKNAIQNKLKSINKRSK
jgi:hypothetical protein